MTPEGAAAELPKPRRDDTLIKALARAHRWRLRIESGRAKSITDLAEQEGGHGPLCLPTSSADPLTCLGPDIVEAILAGSTDQGICWSSWSGRFRKLGGAGQVAARRLR